MRLDMATDSLTAWTQLYEAISEAKESVYMEMYAFYDDIQTHDFVGLLESKARQGVKVLMVLDAYGSYDLPARTIRRLNASGVDLRFFRHWVHRTHRKLTIVDDKIALLGGVNIGKMFTDWVDLQIAFRGHMVERLVKSFERSYRLAGGQSTVIGHKHRRKYRARMWAMEHAPISGQRSLRKYYQRKIERATRSIVLVTPYFAPGRWLEDSLIEAIKRGVKVELHLPIASDLKSVDHLSRYFASRAVRYGVQVFLSRNMNHAKAMLIDDDEGLIGSGNLEPLSFRLNNEIGVFFTEPRAIQGLKETIAKWSADSMPFDSINYKVPWWKVLVAPFFKLIYPAF